MLRIPIPGRQRVWGEQGGLVDKLEVSDGVVNARAKHTPLRHAGVYAPTVERGVIEKNKLRFELGSTQAEAVRL